MQAGAQAWLRRWSPPPTWGIKRPVKGGLAKNLEAFLGEEIEAERKAERVLHARALAELVSSGEATWATVIRTGDETTELKLEGPARVREGDHLRMIPKLTEATTLAELVRAAKGHVPRHPPRCRSREKEKLVLGGDLELDAGDRVLLLDPAPHTEPNEALLDASDRIVRSASVAALAGAKAKAFAPHWLGQEEVLAALSKPKRGTRVVQGPPGSGKTHLIAELALRRQRQGQSVLVVAFTHRALLQVAEGMIRQGTRTDAKPWYRERTADLVPRGCRHRPDLPRGEGLRKSTLLVTAAKVAASWRREPPAGWDVVIVDEASQLALPALLAAVGLADEAIVVGDPQQLPPVARSESAAELPACDGLAWIAARAPEAWAIRDTRRMNAPIAGLASRAFYSGELRALDAAAGGNGDRFLPLQGWRFAEAVPSRAGARMLLHGGTPDDEARLAAELIGTLDAHLKGVDPFTGRALTYAVATPRRDHVARLQGAFAGLGPLAKRITAETVERLQGSTASVCLYATGEAMPTPTGPSRDLSWTLSSRRLNVALTRGCYLALVLATRPYAEKAASVANGDEASRKAFAELLAGAASVQGGGSVPAPVASGANLFSPQNLARLTRNIPRGSVATFGTLARWAGDPSRAKDVFPLLLEAKRMGLEVFDHRVVKRSGELHPAQAWKLRREGVDPDALKFVS